MSAQLCVFIFHLILSLLYNSAATFCRSEFIFVAVFMKNFSAFQFLKLISVFGNLFLLLYSLFFSVFLFLIVLFPVSEKLLFSLSLSLSLSLSFSLCIRITINVYRYCLKNPLTKHYSYIFLC